MCTYKYKCIHSNASLQTSFLCTQTHTNVARWPADGVGLMYFDDMKVDHIYMQIEVPD